MTKQELASLSIYMSYILRHNPDEIGLPIDCEGWVSIQDFVARSVDRDETITLERVLEVIERNEKKRFTLSDDKLRMRAAQGHSTALVNRKYERVVPLYNLYHGTLKTTVPAIQIGGLLAMARHHVHLSATETIAQKVGNRHRAGESCVLQVSALTMHDLGYEFFLAENGVWLTAAVPPQFIVFP